MSTTPRSNSAQRSENISVASRDVPYDNEESSELGDEEAEEEESSATEVEDASTPGAAPVVAEKKNESLGMGGMKLSSPAFQGMLSSRSSCLSSHSRINKGTDMFDHERKYAEDEKFQEMGPMARVWKVLLEEYAKLDGDKVEDWRDGLDVLLVFVCRLYINAELL